MHGIAEYCRRNRKKLDDQKVLEVTDVLYRAILEGQNINYAPEDLVLAHRTPIYVQTGAEVDLYWSAPEIIFNRVESNRDTNLFSLGLYIFSLCAGESYYEKYPRIILSDLNFLSKKK